MAEMEKKAKAPTKPRKTASKKAATVNGAASNVTEMPAPNGHVVARTTATHEEIAHLAHRFWAERGHQHGRDAEDWFRAEQELRGKAS